MFTGIILGDGTSRQAHWLTSKLKEKPVLMHSLEAMHKSRLDSILLVMGKDYHLVLNKLNIPQGKTQLLMNHRFDRGMSSYVKVGMYSLPPGTEAVVLMPAEYPQVTSGIIDRMLDEFQKEPSGILVPMHQEERGFPVLFHHRYFDALRKVMKNDIGLSLIERFIQDVRFVQFSEAGVVRTFEKIRHQETAEIESVRLDGIRSAQSVPRKQDSPRPQAAAANIAAPAASPAAAVEPAPAVPSPSSEKKKEIIEKLREKVEARVKEEKQKLVERRDQKDLDLAEPPDEKPSEDPIDGKWEDFAQISLEEMAQRASARPVEAEALIQPIEARGQAPAPVPAAVKAEPGLSQAKEDKNLSLKMLNDLLGKGKEKKEGQK